LVHLSYSVQLQASSTHYAFPYKFNHHWLEDSDFNCLVHSVWKNPLFLQEINPQQRMVWKLKVLKIHTKAWLKEKKEKDHHNLIELESAISKLIMKSSRGALPLEDSELLKDLELTRNSILCEEENSWRLRSRATWLKGGDANTKFFHKVASFNRNKKFIWSISNDFGDTHTGQKAIKEAVVSHFCHFFKASDSTSISDSTFLANLYPTMVSEMEAAELYRPVTLLELKFILTLFKKERSPGPDGWTSEFFIHFFDLVGDDLLQMVEHSRINGKVIGSINSTFLALIPKENNSASFNDYRPISLCNLIYKISSKILSNRIKPFLERCLSAEQMGFLKGRRIQDAIGAAHEGLHSIKKKNTKALVLKLDLKKAFDSIDWGFLRLILLSAGFGIKMTDWMMACVSSASFVVLINGEATKFFRSERGLRQGCPLSPYLFILIMEGLSLLLTKNVSEQQISGIKVSKFINLVHLIFVDDVLLMSKATPSEWIVILELLQIFCTASGLSINFTKSTAHYWGLTRNELCSLKESLPFTFVDLSQGFKYLGYVLKPGAKNSDDWRWLVAKFERKISFWCNKWLSIGGRFILVNSVLHSISVFWMSLEKIPSSILNLLRRLSFNFLWNGQKDTHRFHLCSWNIISKPIKAGGWGLKNLAIFNTALLANSFWRALTHNSLWHRVILINTWEKSPFLIGSENLHFYSRGRPHFGRDFYHLLMSSCTGSDGGQAQARTSLLEETRFLDWRTGRSSLPL
jgi:hypothetical protein